MAGGRHLWPGGRSSCQAGAAPHIGGRGAESLHSRGPPYSPSPIFGTRSDWDSRGDMDGAAAAGTRGHGSANALVLRFAADRHPGGASGPLPCRRVFGLAQLEYRANGPRRRRFSCVNSGAIGLRRPDDVETFARRLPWTAADSDPVWRGRPARSGADSGRGWTAGSGGARRGISPRALSSVKPRDWRFGALRRRPGRCRRRDRIPTRGAPATTPPDEDCAIASPKFLPNLFLPPP